MCLAVPAKVIDAENDDALVDLMGNRMHVSTVLTPGVRDGDWVLVHAGFAITTLDERAALETWDYLRSAYGEAEWAPGAGAAQGTRAAAGAPPDDAEERDARTG